MNVKKPKLSIDEQIEHLKGKGVLFNIMGLQPKIIYFSIIIILSLLHIERIMISIRLEKIAISTSI